MDQASPLGKSNACTSVKESLAVDRPEACQKTAVDEIPTPGPQQVPLAGASTADSEALRAEARPVQGGVAIRLCVENIDFDALANYPELRAAFEAASRQRVAQEAGVPLESIVLRMAPGT